MQQTKTLYDTDTFLAESCEVIAPEAALHRTMHAIDCEFEGVCMVSLPSLPDRECLLQESLTTPPSAPAFCWLPHAHKRTCVDTSRHDLHPELLESTARACARVFMCRVRCGPQRTASRAPPATRRLPAAPARHPGAHKSVGDAPPAESFAPQLARAHRG